MFRRSGLFVFALITVPVFSPQSIAADIHSKESGSFKDAPSYSRPTTWAGLYFGAHAGYGWGDSEIGDGGTEIGDPPYGAFACGVAISGNYCGNPLELSPEGGLAGVQLGYNLQRGNFVFGVEGEFGWLNLEDEKLLVRNNSDQDFGSVEYGMYGTLTLRAGYAFDRTLLYAKGGLAFADIENVAFDLDDGALAPGNETRNSDVQTGWALGAGVEYALGERLSLKAEYLYMDFGSDTSGSPQGDTYEHENAIHTAKVGLNFRLSAPEAETLK